ncbi:MAG: dihydroorotate dehydrogenase-like protein [Bryobacterales bacterium]|jgi:dihydroorotate dehydrogenase (fumarate)|nr:dihydroorotate dehydrogenase-like protein [Bryobacterales bacterium]
MSTETSYMGLTLKNPVVASASPLSRELDHIRHMEDEGAAAVVLYSLFEEQINAESQSFDYFLSATEDFHAEAGSYFPEMIGYNRGPEGYLEHIAAAKAAVSIPVIASLNGVSTGGWVRYARLMEEAGADALELNIFLIPTDLNQSSQDVENTYVEIVREVKSNLRIPLAVKLGPYFSAMGHMARRLDEAGADALVLFNRFYQPDFDLEALEVVPSLNLSNPEELRLRLHWAAILYGRIRADLAITGGVHSGYDVLKSMMAGASVACVTSALLWRGINHIQQILKEMQDWMVEREYASVSEMRGSMSQRAVPDPGAFVRANYMKVLQSYTLRSRVM